MKFVLIAALFALTACGAPSHPLTYVHPNDPVWWANPPDDAVKVSEKGIP